MEEKKTIKISISTFFLILAVIVIIAMGIFSIKMYNEKTVATEKSAELQTQVNELTGTVSGLQGKINSISETISTNNYISNTAVTNENKSETGTKAKTFTDAQVKEAIQDYLNIIGSKEGSPSSVLDYLKLKGKESTARKEGYLKTDIKYSKFKKSILEYITERCFKEEFSEAFIEEDGYVCYFNGGATGVGYEVNSITKVNDKTYNAKAVWMQEESKEDVSFEFGIENSNGKCVIDYCNQK